MGPVDLYYAEVFRPVGRVVGTYLSEPLERALPTVHATGDLSPPVLCGAPAPPEDREPGHRVLVSDECVVVLFGVRDRYSLSALCIRSSTILMASSLP